MSDSLVREFTEFTLCSKENCEYYGALNCKICGRSYCFDHTCEHLAMAMEPETMGSANNNRNSGNTNRHGVNLDSLVSDNVSDLSLNPSYDSGAVDFIDPEALESYSSFELRQLRDKLYKRLKLVQGILDSREDFTLSVDFKPRSSSRSRARTPKPRSTPKEGKKLEKAIKALEVLNTSGVLKQYLEQLKTRRN